MFGKGIYFADMVSKSANYCCTNPTNNTGGLSLMLTSVADPDPPDPHVFGSPGNQDKLVTGMDPDLDLAPYTSIIMQK